MNFLNERLFTRQNLRQQTAHTQTVSGHKENSIKGNEQ
jgi:hypothetical protein